jgi:hypothetical protein
MVPQKDQCASGLCSNSDSGLTLTRPEVMPWNMSAHFPVLPCAHIFKLKELNYSIKLGIHGSCL